MKKKQVHINKKIPLMDGGYDTQQTLPFFSLSHHLTFN